MVWVRLDDNISEHPKIAKLDDHAFALFVAGLAYCNRNETDGDIPTAVGLGQLRYQNGNTVPSIRQLEEIGLWEKREDGWHVHDYEHYQPTKAQLEAERREAKERMARVRSHKKGSSGNVRKNTKRTSDNPVPGPGVSVVKASSSSATSHSTLGRTALKNALVDCSQWDQKTMTTNEWGRVEQAAKQLEGVSATPDDIQGFGIFWQQKWGEAPSPQAVVNNWSEYKAGKLFQTKGRR